MKGRGEKMKRREEGTGKRIKPEMIEMLGQGGVEGGECMCVCVCWGEKEWGKKKAGAGGRKITAELYSLMWLLCVGSSLLLLQGLLHLHFSLKIAPRDNLFSWSTPFCIVLPQNSFCSVRSLEGVSHFHHLFATIPPNLSPH